MQIIGWLAAAILRQGMQGTRFRRGFRPLLLPDCDILTCRLFFYGGVALIKPLSTLCLYPVTWATFNLYAQEPYNQTPANAVIKYIANYHIATSRQSVRHRLRPDRTSFCTQPTK